MDIFFVGNFPTIGIERAVGIGHSHISLSMNLTKQKPQKIDKMNYIIFFNKYFDENPLTGDPVNLDKFSKALVNAYIEHESYIRDNYCAMCGVILTDSDKRGIAPEHFHRMCSNHVQYSGYYQLVVLAEKQNMPKPWVADTFFDK